MTTNKPKTARLIRQLNENDGWTQSARLYILSVACPYRTISKPTVSWDSPTTKYVVVSSGLNKSENRGETKVFYCDAIGRTSFFEMLSQAEVPGLDRFDEALRVLGYKVETETQPDHA